MNEEGTRYAVEILHLECVIEQTEKGDFELLVAGKKKGIFSSATKAREELISVIRAQFTTDDAMARKQVPQLSNWSIQRTGPIDPEES